MSGLDWGKYEVDGGERYFATMGFFSASIISPEESGGHALLVEYDDRGGYERRVFGTLQEAKDAAVPLALEILDGWREEVLEIGK